MLQGGSTIKTVTLDIKSCGYIYDKQIRCNIRNDRIYAAWLTWQYFLLPKRNAGIIFIATKIFIASQV